MSLVFVIASCGSRENTPSPKTETSAQNEIDVWITKADETIKLQKQTSILAFTTASNSFQNIEIDPSKTYQNIDGFGYTLTGGSVEVINQLSASKKEAFFKNFWKRRKFYRDKLS
jgi:glucosylceramidase